MKLSDFMYDLPEERIAQTPVEIKGNLVYPTELIPHILSGSKEVFHFVSKQI